MNINSAIIEGAKILKNKTISTASLDAEILMAKAVNKDRKYILLNYDKQVNQETLNKFEK